MPRHRSGFRYRALLQVAPSADIIFASSKEELERFLFREIFLFFFFFSVHFKPKPPLPRVRVPTVTHLFPTFALLACLSFDLLAAFHIGVTLKVISFEIFTSAKEKDSILNVPTWFLGATICQEQVTPAG